MVVRGGERNNQIKKKSPGQYANQTSSHSENEIVKRGIIPLGKIQLAGGRWKEAHVARMAWKRWWACPFINRLLSKTVISNVQRDAKYCTSIDT